MENQNFEIGFEIGNAEIKYILKLFMFIHFSNCLLYDSLRECTQGKDSVCLVKHWHGECQRERQNQRKITEKVRGKVGITRQESA